MIPKLRLCAFLLLAVTLASCGDSSKDDAKQASAANSEVLKGTISDDMIAYDTLRSQPPPAKIVPDEAAAADDGESKAPADAGETEPAAQEAGGNDPDAANAPERNSAATSAPTTKEE